MYWKYVIIHLQSEQCYKLYLVFVNGQRNEIGMKKVANLLECPNSIYFSVLIGEEWRLVLI
jgi:hypothetical protein